MRRPTPAVERVCPECGDAFSVQGNSSRRLYCSKPCKQRAWRNLRSIGTSPICNARWDEPRPGACPRCDLMIGEKLCWICEAELAGRHLIGALVA